MLCLEVTFIPSEMKVIRVKVDASSQNAIDTSPNTINRVSSHWKLLPSDRTDVSKRISIANRATKQQQPTKTSVNTITTTNKSNLSHDLSPFAPLFRNFCARLTRSDRFRTSTAPKWHFDLNVSPSEQWPALSNCCPCLGCFTRNVDACLTHLNCCVYCMCTENLPNFANVEMEE